MRYLMLSWLNLLVTSAVLAGSPSAEFLSDMPERLILAEQDWGELGWDTAAHQASLAGQPMRLAGHAYAKGLGHHANGAIVILLDGEYASFDADVGIQDQAARQGSVIFRIFVDGMKRFDSGTMTPAEGAKSVHVDVAAGQELRLEANDAGDGIICDMADWANARLTRNSAKSARPAEPPLDMARFGRVVSWDPNRQDGCRSTRIQEFRAEDLFLETELTTDANGFYRVPVTTNGLACIGLQWLNRCALKEAALQLAAPGDPRLSNDVRIEGWYGESAWQGRWQPLKGNLQITGDQLTFKLDFKANGKGLFQTQKIRWILPAQTNAVLVRSLSAFTRTRWNTTNLVIEVDQPTAQSPGELTAYNGEINESTRVRWDLNRPLQARVRYSQPSAFKSDATVLQFRLPSGSVGVAVEDVLRHGSVYVADHGLLVALPPASLAAYRQSIEGQRTILQEVRARPEQTFEAAMARTHHEAQNEGPVMLSLACDNAKFVVGREGSIQFQTTSKPGDDWFASATQLRPQLGKDSLVGMTRQLQGGWLPAPIIETVIAGVHYQQHTFVAPCDEAGQEPARLNRKSVCVADFTLTNNRSEPTNVTLTLSFLPSSRAPGTFEFKSSPQGFYVLSQNATIARVDISPASLWQPKSEGATLSLTAALPPRAQAQCVVYLPGMNFASNDWSHLKPARVLSVETVDYWKAVLAPAMQIDTPNHWLNDLIRSSQVRCLIAARNEADGARIAPWVAAMSYGPLESEANSIIRGMDFFGHTEFARRGLDFFIHRYNAEGFLTTGYTTFGTAWHLWTLGEYCQLHHDVAWLSRIAPAITRVGQWIIRQTEKTKRLDAQGQPVPEYGLMPPGVMADWNAFAYHFCLNAYYYAALREVGTALQELQDPNGPVFLQAAADLRANILRAYQWTQAQAPALPLRNGTWIPAYPSQLHSPGKLADFFPGQDAGRSWCYDVELGAHQLVPAGVLDPSSPEVTRMLNHMEDQQFLADGWFDYPAAMNQQDWFNLGGFSKVQPYYTRNGEIYAMRDEVKPFLRSYFNTLAAMLNPEILTFWEHFHHSGAWDKTHETGYFLQQTRFLAVMEHGDELWLAPMLPRDWLKDGQTVTVANAPTRFGRLNYSLTSHAAEGYIDANFQFEVIKRPSKIVLRLRHPQSKLIQRVLVNGKNYPDYDTERECILFAPGQPTVTLRSEYAQSL